MRGLGLWRGGAGARHREAQVRSPPSQPPLPRCYVLTCFSLPFPSYTQDIPLSVESAEVSFPSSPLRCFFARHPPNALPLPPRPLTNRALQKFRTVTPVPRVRCELEQGPLDQQRPSYHPEAQHISEVAHIPQQPQPPTNPSFYTYMYKINHDCGCWLPIHTKISAEVSPAAPWPEGPC